MLRNGLAPRGLDIGRVGAGPALARVQHHGVEVNEVPQSCGQPVGDTGDHHAAITVPDRDRVEQLFAFDHGHHVGNVRILADGG